jgi:hypothetical protein
MRAANVAETTAFNRTVYAAPAVAGLAYEKPQSAYGLCAVFLRHIWGGGQCCALPITRPKRRKQPERYAKCGLNLIKNYVKRPRR